MAGASRKKIHIKDHKHAAEIARDLHQLRESMRAARALEERYKAALTRFLDEHNEDEIEQENFDTLKLRETVGSYLWDCVNMPDDDLALLRHYGLLTVKKGEYDKAIEEHGPLGLLDKWAMPQYHRELRFFPRAPRRRKYSA